MSIREVVKERAEHRQKAREVVDQILDHVLDVIEPLEPSQQKIIVAMLITELNIATRKDGK
jgi:predicted secreted protein